MATQADELISIEVFYASTDNQLLVALEVEAGTTVDEAVVQSGVLERFPELKQQPLNMGIFAEPCDGDRALKAYDRVEIYRPLLIDPREARRQRVAREREEGGA